MSISKGLVSIITPLFNNEKYIEATINSVLGQTYPNWELIIVDDCSTDRGTEIVREFQEADPRIVLLINDRNLGPALTRNKAIEAAQGEFIAFLDSDDLWLPQKLELQIAVMKRSKCPFTYTYYRQVEEDGAFAKNIADLPTTVTYKDLLRFNFIGCLTAIYDVNFFGKVYMENIRNRQDYALWLTLLKKINHARCVPEILAEYRLRDDSISSNKIRLIKYHWHIYYHIEKLGPLKSALLILNYITRKIVQR